MSGAGRGRGNNGKGVGAWGGASGVAKCFLQKRCRQRCKALCAASSSSSKTEQSCSSPTSSSSYNALKYAVLSDTKSTSPKISSTSRLFALAQLGEHVPYAAIAGTFLPDTRHSVVDVYQSRIYGGKFIGEHGNAFVTSCQDPALRVYDTRLEQWNMTHNIVCEDVVWTLTDFDVCPNGRYLAYCTMNSLIHVVDLHNPKIPHLTFSLSKENRERDFYIMSIVWSADGTEIIAGTSSGRRNGRSGLVIAYNVQAQTCVDYVSAHTDDVNSVCFLREQEHNVLLSASDDATAKYWDRRELARTRKGDEKCAGSVPGAGACGVFVGHCEGLTHVSAKNDGRFLITNGKDQEIKLWDIRRASDASSGNVRLPPRVSRWDYRYTRYPGRRYAANYQDDSVKSYRGEHETLQTLIRAYFSPAHTTGQRYIYSGSSNGRVAVYDVLTGNPVRSLNGHRAPVRDVSWHPNLPYLATVSWDCQVMLWSTKSAAERHKQYAETPMDTDEPVVWCSPCPQSRFPLCGRFGAGWIMRN